MNALLNLCCDKRPMRKLAAVLVVILSEVGVILVRAGTVNRNGLYHWGRFAR